MEEKWSKVIVHSSAFYAPFLVPIIFFLIGTDHEVKRLSIQAVLFQIVFGILLGISIVFSFILIGLPFLVIFGIIYFGAPIIGIYKAVNETPWDYPIVGRWV